MTSGFVYGSAAEAEAAFKQDGSRYVYSRYRNPTVTMFEERLRLIEGAEACRATASGMAAVFAALLVQVARGAAGRGEPRLVRLVPLHRRRPAAALRASRPCRSTAAIWRRGKTALAPGAALTFCESPSNPAMEIIDIAEVARLTHRAGGILVVDNVFATPLVAEAARARRRCRRLFRDQAHRRPGPRARRRDPRQRKIHQGRSRAVLPPHRPVAVSPFNAWLLLKGLETLELRVERQCRTAEAIARFLESHPKMTRVVYPGLPSHPQYELAQAPDERAAAPSSRSTSPATRTPASAFSTR